MASAPAKASNASARRAAISAGRASKVLRRVFSFGLPGGEVGNPIGGVLGSFGPAGALGGDDAAAVGPGGIFAGQRVAFGAGGGLARADGGERGAGLVHRQAQFGDVRQGGLGGPDLCEGSDGLIAFHCDSRQLVVGGGQPSGGCGGLIAQTGEGSAGAFEFLFPIPSSVAGALFGGHGRLRGSFGRRTSAVLGRCFLFGGCEADSERGQPVALLQPNRGLGRCAGANGIAVPPPSGPGTGDQ